MRRPLAPSGRHLQESLLLVFGFGFPGQTNEFFGDAAIFIGCGHDVPTGQLLRAPARILSQTRGHDDNPRLLPVPRERFCHADFLAPARRYPWGNADSVERLVKNFRSFSGFRSALPVPSLCIGREGAFFQPRENARARKHTSRLIAECSRNFRGNLELPKRRQQPRRKVAGAEPAALCHIEGGVRAHFAFCQRGTTMRNSLWAAVSVLTISLAPTGGAQADTVGAAAGAGTGLVVAGPVGAVVGGVVGAVWGRPFWGPPHSPHACWIDNHFYRHCRWSHGHW